MYANHDEACEYYKSGVCTCTPQPKTPVFNLDKFQSEVSEWANKNFGVHQPSILPLLGLGEEVGELNHAHLKGAQGIRYTPQEIVSKKRDAIGDLFIYAADYCAREGLSLTDCIRVAWEGVKERDWKNNPMNAHQQNG